MKFSTCLILVGLSLPAWSQENSHDGGPSPIEILLDSGLSDATGLENLGDVGDALVEALDNPKTQSKILNRIFTDEPSWQFLKDIEFKFKAFDVAGTSESGLGFSYEYDKTITDRPIDCMPTDCVRGLDFSLSAVGNVAFDSDTNPNDFLNTTASFSFFQSRGGVPPARDKADDTEVDEASAISEDLFELEEEFVEADEDSEDEEKAIQDIISLIRPTLSNQFYFEIAGDASLESNQRFTEKQYAYGIHGVIEIKGWSNDSQLSRFNVFDYPFAVIRMLSDYEDCGACFRPRGTSWPTLLVGFDRVSPQDNDPRAQAGDASDFDRLRVELSFRTPIARINDDHIYATLNYRFYEEQSAIPAVEAADLDRFDYYTVTIGGSDGIYVSYADGKLPLDATNDKVYELGFQFQLGK